MPRFGQMESFTIKINDEQANGFLKPVAEIQSLLFLLFEPGTANYQLLAYELQREFRQGGSPDVTRIAFDRVAFDPSTGNGRVRVLLDIRFTFGCEDSVTEKKDQTSEWTFSVDAATNTIRFYSSPFADSRSTADEF